MLIIADSTPQKKNQRENEFEREANRLYQLHRDDATIVTIGKMKSFEKRTKVFDSILKNKKLDSLALFCHGWQKGLSLGFSSKRGPIITDEVESLAQHISAVCSTRKIKIALYACLTGRGCYWWWKRKNNKTLLDRPKNIENAIVQEVTYKDGFAMLLCSELKKLGVQALVTAHLTAGHTTMNPNKVSIFPEPLTVDNPSLMSKSICRVKKTLSRKLLVVPESTLRFDCALGEQ